MLFCQITAKYMNPAAFRILVSKVEPQRFVKPASAFLCIASPDNAECLSLIMIEVFSKDMRAEKAGCACQQYISDRNRLRLRNTVGTVVFYQLVKLTEFLSGISWELVFRRINIGKQTLYGAMIKDRLQIEIDPL